MSTIEMNRLLTELKIATAQAKGISNTLENQPTDNQFGTILNDAINKVNDVQLESGQLQKKFELGDPSVELPHVMIAMEKSKIAFTAMSEVRNKLIKAYQEIMSMPV